jgi:hypothetical protein
MAGVSFTVGLNRNMDPSFQIGTVSTDQEILLESNHNQDLWIKFENDIIGPHYLPDGEKIKIFSPASVGEYYFKLVATDGSGEETSSYEIAAQTIGSENECYFRACVSDSGILLARLARQINHSDPTITVRIFNTSGSSVPININGAPHDCNEGSNDYQIQVPASREILLEIDHGDIADGQQRLDGQTGGTEQAEIIIIGP